jgi:hypothetical protein
LDLTQPKVNLVAAVCRWVEDDDTDGICVAKFGMSILGTLGHGTAALGAWLALVFNHRRTRQITGYQGQKVVDSDDADI